MKINEIELRGEMPAEHLGSNEVDDVIAVQEFIGTFEKTELGKKIKKDFVLIDSEVEDEDTGVKYIRIAYEEKGGNSG